jgi:hypothetical protein
MARIFADEQAPAFDKPRPDDEITAPPDGMRPPAIGGRGGISAYGGAGEK